MLPSIDNLRCFVAAARVLNFRNAARAVALTPAAFGQRIRQLEDQIGAPLFARTTRSVHLTEAGLSLMPSAERCIAAAEECIRAAKGESGPAPMDIIIGTRQELGLSWVLPQLDELTKKRPYLNFNVYFGSGPDLLLRVRLMEVDCAVTSTRFSDPKLDSVRLHREDYVFCGSRSLLKKTPFTQIEHAAKHSLVDVSADLALFRYWKDAPGGSDRMRFLKTTWLGTIEAIRRRVLRGEGVAVLPEYVVSEELRTGELRRIFPAVKPLHDYFRLVFRTDDAKRSIFESIAQAMLRVPLQ